MQLGSRTWSASRITYGHLADVVVDRPVCDATGAVRADPPELDEDAAIQSVLSIGALDLESSATLVRPVLERDVFPSTMPKHLTLSQFSSLCGLYVGDYSVHGPEFISVDIVANHWAMDPVGGTEGPWLVARKITGGELRVWNTVR